jgi:hypothetical protein
MRVRDEEELHETNETDTRADLAGRQHLLGRSQAGKKDNA